MTEPKAPPPLRSILAIAGWELKGAIRSRWVLGTSALFTAASVGVALLGLRSLRAFGLSGVGPASAGLLNLGVLLPPLLGLLLGAGSIAGARERGLLSMMAAQPVSRGGLVAGIFLGLTAAMWMTLALAFGLTGVVLAGVARGGDLAPFLALVGAATGAATASVAIGMAVSALATSRTQAMAAATAIWFLLAMGMDFALAGLTSAVRLGPAGLMIAALINPLEGARILAALGAGPNAAALAAFGSYLKDSYGVGGAAAVLIASLLAWTALPLGVAWLAVARRDL